MKKEKKILINILTRTSNRPVGFLNCYNSIEQQSYCNKRHIVAYDNEADYDYLNKLDIDIVFVGNEIYSYDKPFNSEGNSKAPYNFYNNNLLSEVSEGWILFLDDDDHLYHNKVLEEIVQLIQNYKGEDVIFIWQMRYPDGKLLPTNKMIDNEVVKKNNIGSPCFLFHSKFKDQAKWDGYKASDYRFLEILLKETPNKIFVKKVVAQINNHGDLGAKNDLFLKSNFKNRIIFNKNLLWHLIPKLHFELFGIPVFQKSTYVDFKNKVIKYPKRIINFIKTQR